MVSFTDRLKSRVSKPADIIDDNDRPKFSKADLTERINISQAISFPKQHDLTIDVLPDVRHILLVIQWHIMKHFSSGNFRDNAFITPVSVTAYCLQLVYGFFLINDFLFRNNMSPYAARIAHLPITQRLIELLATAYIPPFLVPILTNLLPHTLEGYNKTEFVSTLACFLFSHDYGRIIPASLFIHAHNTIASANTRAHVDTITASWLSQKVITIGSSHWQVNDFFASVTENFKDGSPSALYENWFSNRMFSLCNPVTSRFQASRPTFSRINCTAQTVPSWNDLSPYFYLLGITDYNTSEILSFIGSTSSYMKDNFNAGLTMQHIVESSSGSGIVSHMISRPVLPTWLNGPNLTSITPNSKGDYNIERHSPSEFAALIEFLTLPTSSTNHDIGYPKDTTDLIDTDALLIHKYNLPAVSTPTETAKAIQDQSNQAMLEWILFNPTQHYTPQMLFFNARSSPASAAINSIFSGLLIENGQIDGFGIHVDNPDMSANDNNGQNRSSAVHAPLIMKATDISKFHSSTDHSHTSVPLRTLVQWPQTKNAILYRDMSRHYKPSFYKQVGISASMRPNWTLATGLGLHTGKVNLFGHDSLSLIARRVSKDDNATNVAGSPVYLWSSYRILEQEQHDNYGTATDVSAISRVSFLCSLREYFGSQSVVGQMEHPIIYIS